MPNTPDIARIIDRYLALRDRKKLLKKQYEEPIRALDERMRHLEGYLLQYMQEQSLDRVPTSAGTAYPSEKFTVRVTDWPIALDFIRERDAWHLLAQRLSDAGVREYLNDGILVPGIDTNTWVTVNVRRKD